ncbi:MAG: hypothetical protein R2827_01155 [Bdellovibrionales bacterium]
MILDTERTFDARTRNALKFAILMHIGLAVVIGSGGSDFTRKIYTAKTPIESVEFVALEVGDAEFPTMELANVPKMGAKDSSESVEDPVVALPEKTQMPIKKLNARTEQKPSAKKTRQARKHVKKVRNQMATSLPEKRRKKNDRKALSAIRIDFEKPDHKTEAGDHFTTRELAKLKVQEDAYERYLRRLRELEKNGG